MATTQSDQTRFQVLWSGDAATLTASNLGMSGGLLR